MMLIILFLSWVFLEVTQATNPCPSPPCLFYTDTTTIKSFRLSNSGSTLSTVTSNLRRSAAITADVRRKLLFWSDINRDVIQSLNLTSGHVQDVVTKNIANVRGMAVDWETGLVYWTDYERREVSVVTYDGTKRKTLITDGVINPHGIAVDARNGIMFWTDLGYRSRIQRATLSGHNQTTIVNLSQLSQRWPHGITIDYTNNRLYWLDSMEDQIMSVDYNGKNRILHRSFFDIHAFSLDLLGDLLYWSDSVRFSTRIRSIDKTHGGNAGVYHNVGYSTVMGIVIYDQSRQPRGNTSCVKGRHRCQYLCLLSPHGPKCACPDGQILNQDGTTCKESTKTILLTTLYPRAIYQIPQEIPQPAMKRVPLSNLGYPNAIDVNPIDGRVYWSDSWQRSISRAFLNGTSQEIIVEMVRIPDGLAVDWAAGNLYWTDRLANRIEVAKLDGKYRKTLIYRDLERPTKIVLDLKTRCLYWASAGFNLPPRIEQADMTGGNRRVLANLVYPAWPTGVTILGNRLYWIDEYHNVLQYLDRVSPAGVVTLHLPRQLSEASLLASVDGFLYLLDKGLRANDGTLVKIDKDTGRVLQNVIRFINRPSGIAAVDFNVTSVTSDACSPNNGNCSHLCLLEPSGRQCACPDGMTLKDDGKTCYFKDFLLYADAGGRRRGIYKLPLDRTSAPTKLPLSDIQRPTALDFDPLNKFLYWTDVRLDRIMRAHLDGSSQTNVITSGLRRPQGLAVDAIGRNLYWTDMDSNVIEVSKLNGSCRKVLMSNLDQPKAIVLDLQRGYMYWSSWGQLAKIERADMNGANRTLIQSFPNSDHWSGVPPSPNGLALDPETNLIYWIDEFLGTLKYMDLKSHPFRVQNLISSHLYLASPFGLALNEENMFWSEQRHGGGIFSVSKRQRNTVKRVARTSTAPRDVHVYHNATAIPDSHPCTLYNGWCTHLCLVVPGGYRCACPTVTDPGPPCSTVPNRPNITSSPSTTATARPTTATTVTTRGTTVQWTTERQTTTTQPTTAEEYTTTSRKSSSSSSSSTTTPTTTATTHGTVQSTTERQTTTTQPMTTEEYTTASRKSSSSSSSSTTTPTTPTTTTTTATTRGTVQSTTERQTTTTQPTTTEEYTTTSKKSSSSSTSSTTSTTKHATTTATPTTKHTTTTVSTLEPTTTTTPTTKEHTTSPRTTQRPKTRSKPSTKVTPTTVRNPCQPNPCINQGKCTKMQGNVDGFVCLCKDGFASTLCDVFYGEDKVEITLEMKPEEWKTSEFKEGIAKMVNEYCEKQDCQAKYRRRRRASGVQQFTPDDVIVVGHPKAVSNGIKVQTVVLEPRQQNQAGQRKPMSGSLLCAILRDTKESGSSILKGYNILSLNGEEKPTCPGAPIVSKNKGQRSGGSDSSGSSGSAAAGGVVGVLCVLILVVILFYCYRKRRQRRQKEENEVRPNVTFSNPGFQEEPGTDDPLSPTYEEIGPDLRDEILGLNTSLPWQEDFGGLSNPAYHGLDRRAQAARAQPQPQLEENRQNRLKEELRVNMKLEGDSSKNSNPTNPQNSDNYGNGPSRGNLGNSASESNAERYVTMPVRGMLSRTGQAHGHNLREEHEYASIPVDRCKAKVNTQEPEYSNGRSRPKVDKKEPKYSSIPSGRDYTNQHSLKKELNTEPDDLYEKMNSDKIVRRPPLGPPPEDPALNGTYVAPDSLGNDEEKVENTYANANDITGLPLQEDPKEKHTYVNADTVNKLNEKPSLDEKAMGSQGDKIHKGQENTNDNGPQKELS